MRVRDEQRRANEELARYVAPDHLESLNVQLRELVAEARAVSPEDHHAPAPRGSQTDGPGE